MKILKLLILISLLMVFTPSYDVYAQSEFQTDYQVNYLVTDKHILQINQEITLTNKLSNIYAASYTFSLSGLSISQVQAFDSIGPLKTEVIQNQDGSTSIHLTFNQPVIGTGKSLKFNLNYQADNLLKKNGQIWQINIPKLSAETAPENYQLTLTVPKNLGNLAYIRPTPIEELQVQDQRLYKFSKEQALSTGIDVAFGDFQIFDFSLTYHLENLLQHLGETEIALPPDSFFQQLAYWQINPTPENIRRDSDGNWLAKYSLAPGEKTKVIASGQVKIFAEPQIDLFTFSPDQIDHNLKAQKYWDINEQPIADLASKLKNVNKIYNYVVNTLNYDSTRVKDSAERMGALWALNNPNHALCMEFTDLFIAIARAAGIPAREINGYAYTTNEKLRPLGLKADILHAWPEYYDLAKKIWIPVDPTWENTTGGIDYFYKNDLYHFVFVIHGLNSEEPYPAGSYKTEGDLASKDVEINFGEFRQISQPHLEVMFNLPKQLFWGIKNKGSLVIKNTGTSAANNIKFQMSGEGLRLQSYDSNKTAIDVLPPFAHQEVNFEIKSQNLFRNRPSLVKININDQEYSQEIPVRFFMDNLLLEISALIMISVLVFSLTKLYFYVKKSS